MHGSPAARGCGDGGRGVVTTGCTNGVMAAINKDLAQNTDAVIRRGCGGKGIDIKRG